MITKSDVGQFLGDCVLGLNAYDFRFYAMITKSDVGQFLGVCVLGLFLDVCVLGL